MHFGSEEMKNLLLAAHNDSAMYDAAMEQLYETVEAYTRSKLVRGFAEGEVGYGSKPLTTGMISSQDYDDIVGDVFCNVIKSLDRFIANLEADRYSERQRQAWLRKIIYNTIAKYLSKMVPSGFDVSIQQLQESGHDKEISWNPQPLDNLQFNEFTKALIRIVAAAPSKPEKILAYIFNVLIFKVKSDRNQNGMAQFTSSYMNGKQLFVLKNSMIDALYEVYGIVVGAEEIGPLNDALGDKSPTEKGLEICHVTPRNIADWTNRMKTYMFEHKNEVLGEEEAFNAGKK